MIDYYARLIALRKENPDWFDAQRSIVTTPGDELVFRVNGYAVFANPEDTPIAINVADIAVAGDGWGNKQWCAVLSSGQMGVTIDAGDGDYIAAYVCNLAAPLKWSP